MKNLKIIIILITISSIGFIGCSKEKDPPQPAPTNNGNGGGSPTYTKFTISTVKVNNITLSGWDTFNNADVYYTFSDVNYAILYTSTTWFPNASSLPLNFTVNPSYVVNNLSATIWITLWDEDLSDVPSNADDIMEMFKFVFSDYTSTYPTSINKTVGTSSITIIGSWS